MSFFIGDIVIYTISFYREVKVIILGAHKRKERRNYRLSKYSSIVIVCFLDSSLARNFLKFIASLCFNLPEPEIDLKLAGSVWMESLLSFCLGTGKEDDERLKCLFIVGGGDINIGS